VTCNHWDGPPQYCGHSEAIQPNHADPRDISLFASSLANRTHRVNRGPSGIQQQPITLAVQNVQHFCPAMWHSDLMRSPLFSMFLRVLSLGRKDSAYPPIAENNLPGAEEWQLTRLASERESRAMRLFAAQRAAKL
jgi:hypothetical protein